MSIRVQCDNCKNILRDTDEETSGAKAEPSGTLELNFDGKVLFRMDLCPRCARRYLKKLQGTQEIQV